MYLNINGRYLNFSGRTSTLMACDTGSSGGRVFVYPRLLVNRTPTPHQFYPLPIICARSQRLRRLGLKGTADGLEILNVADSEPGGSPLICVVTAGQNQPPRGKESRFGLLCSMSWPKPECSNSWPKRPTHGYPDTSYPSSEGKLVGPAGFEPATKGFKFARLSALLGLCHHPRLDPLRVTGVDAVIKGAEPLR